MRFQDDHQTEGDEELLQMTAMVDVVFILLAFFVLSVQFHGGERDLAVAHADRPDLRGSAPEDFPPQIVLRLEPAEGAAGSVAISVGERRLRDDGYDQITAALAAIDMPEVPVVLVAHSALSVQQVASALDAVLASPMKRVSLGELPES